MFYKYLTLFAALATIIAAAPVASPQTEMSSSLGSITFAPDGTSTFKPKPGPHEVTGPFGTINIAADGSSTFQPWYAPLIPGSEAKAKPWGYRPGKHGGAAAYDGTPRVPLNAGPAAAADPLAVPFY